MNGLGKRGFSIPEVLLAVVILSVGILAMMGSSAAGTKLISRGRRVTIATQVGTAVMDSLRLKSNEDLVACTDLTSNSTGYSKQGTRVTWSIGNYVSTGRTGTRDVDVILQYTATGALTLDTLSSIFKCDV
jgi:prepilin-type N-terminal cleavage/methylation domain-containing protein